MATKFEQHGDVVLAIRISAPSIVTRQRHTWRSAIGLGVGASFLGLSMWFDRTAEDDFTRAAAAVAGLMAHLVSGRWRVEESKPLPRDDRYKLTYRVLQSLEFAVLALVVAMTYWIGFTGAGGRFWLAFAILVPGAFASALLIERGFQELFARIAAARITDARSDSG